MAMLLPLLLSVLAPASVIAPAAAQDSETGLAPNEIWSDNYANQIFPWGEMTFFSSGIIMTIFL